MGNISDPFQWFKRSDNKQNAIQEKTGAFKNLASQTTRIKPVETVTKKTLALPKKPPADPLIAELEMLVSHVMKLKHEAAVYRGVHINQHFRRINAGLDELLTMLDDVKIDSNRMDARELRKKGIRLNKEASDNLLEKIHSDETNAGKDWDDCPKCLKLV